MIRGLMSDEEWACLEPLVIERQRIIALFWMVFSGLHGPALPGAIA